MTGSTPTPELVAVVPARGETASLADVLARLDRALPGVHVLVVMDTPGDPAAAVAREAGAEVLTNTSTGYVGAVHTGIREVHRRGLPRLVVLDADGQHPPEAAPSLVACLAEADVAWASRNGTGSPGSLARRAGNRLLSAWLHLLTGAGLHDVTCGFVALGPDAIAVLATRHGGRFGDVGVRARVVARGLRAVEVPVRIAARQEGISMHRGLAAAGHLVRSLIDVPLEIRFARRELLRG